MMTLPANDAFTLAHDPSGLGLRSSPKLSFVNSTRTPHQTRPQTSERRLVSPPPPPEHVLEPPHSTRLASIPSYAPTLQTSKMDGKRPAPHPVAIDWEIPRKTLHSSIGFLTLWLYTSRGSPHNVVVVLTAGLAVLVPLDFLRLRSPRFERLFERCVGYLMRESEKRTSNGVIWYIIGVIFVLSAYPLDVAVVSIMILSWADTAASTVGRLFGSRTPSLPSRMPITGIPLAPRKSLAGFLAASVTGGLIAVAFWGWIGPLSQAPSSWHWFRADAITNQSATAAGGWIGLGVLGVVSGLVTGVSEALDLGSLDDNLTLPIISGGCLWGFFKLVEYLTS